MSTLAEIERAVASLSEEEKRQLHRSLEEQLAATAAPKQSIFDLPTFSVGRILKPLSSDDDMLGEMLENRK